MLKNLTPIRITATFIVSLLASSVLLFNTNYEVSIVSISIFAVLFIIVELNFFLAEKAISDKRISWWLFFASYSISVILISLLIWESIAFFNIQTSLIILNIKNQVFLFLTLLIGIGMIISTYLIFKKKHIAEQQLILEKKDFLQYSFNALKSQNLISFLKESLEITKELIAKNPKAAVKQLEKLTSILRHLLQTRDQQFVSLRRELEISMEYCSLAELQIEKQVKLLIEVDHEFLDTKVPPLVFQLILEHQFLTFKNNQSKIIQIEVYIENQKFIVVKTSLPDNTRNNDQFIQNLKERYRLHNNSADIFILSTSENHFVKLPLLTQYNN